MVYDAATIDMNIDLVIISLVCDKDELKAFEFSGICTQI